MKKLLLGLIIAGSAFTGFAQQSPRKPVKSKTTTTSSSALKASILRGQTVYNTYCVSCHQADGGGVPSLNAPLIKTSYVLGDKTALIKILLNGMQGVDIDGESYANVMPPATYLSNQQIADVLTYIRNNFGNKATAVTLADVNKVRKQ